MDLDKKTWIYNFPKLHRDNGSAKNEYSRTRNNYKPTIRMFKNARNRLIDRGIISESTAPSYFVECLLYNVPDDKYLGGFGNRYIEILSSLVDSLSHNQGQTLICQNEQSSLFGPESTQWNVGDAAKLLSGLLDLWKNY
ncbi:MAG: hypothetical protein OXN94_07650 [Chloroflexota bacterium]|nr:hypothetical protein [Chloroflexota bacterium]